MIGMVKVYNKGDRPIVFKRTRSGREVIHPGKYDLFSNEKAEEIMNKFPNAISEEEFLKLQEEKKPAEGKKPKGK